ncbi:ammonium transporter [Melioribacter roseus P3M-2]|uniref:Ammonium transporter n=1 Tax=Melioribacter roseus (strain DSM 23840 / JCM 17771 / VKM B-2668 / P3M-2) TaxID=1191523 RepID=I6YYI6_MELRP|nr:ammonium transporter [Melioribacter roseus]AFN75627.1 ammonium transporter [Melioribacter roseus P3M-2]
MEKELSVAVYDNLFTINNLWILISTALVFIMHLGFASLEAGLTQSKNTINILFKNSIIPGIGLLTYAFIGFNLMYPGSDYAGGFLGFSGLWIHTDVSGLTKDYNMGYTYWTEFLFQGMFAATAATIVSGAVAERIKLSSFLIFSTVFVAISYPITGMWKWGGGFLDQLGFYDFAGSTLVHSVGGWGALTGIILLGARKGKYVGNKINPIPGHSMPLATIGVFLLWLGWFGFNGGSVLSADPAAVSLVLVTTSIAAAAGGIAAAFTSWLYLKKPDLTMLLNGILAGLVGITAGADVMSPFEALIVGGIAGVIVVFSVIIFDRLKLDDPVGALSVHLVCGIWGTLAVGIFGQLAGFDQLINQFIGIVSVGVFTLVFTYILWRLLKKTIGIRVSESEEYEGLDLGEHGMEAYPDFEKLV